jgi:mannose-1-phosphate guanylyltransferase/mannose-6-phosphate isomerase
VAKLAPEVHTAAAAAIRDAVPDLDFLRLGGPAYARSPAISVDYAVMKHTGRAAVLPVSYQWSDVGSWDAVSALSPADADGNAILGDGLVVGDHGNLIHYGGRLVTLLGLDNVVVVTTNDGTLVASRTRSEEVKAPASRLEAEGRCRCSAHVELRATGRWPRIPSQAPVCQPWRDFIHPTTQIPVGALGRHERPG